MHTVLSPVHPVHRDVVEAPASIDVRGLSPADRAAVRIGVWLIARAERHRVRSAQTVDTVIARDRLRAEYDRSAVAHRAGTPAIH